MAVQGELAQRGRFATDRPAPARGGGTVRGALHRLPPADLHSAAGNEPEAGVSGRPPDVPACVPALRGRPRVPPVQPHRLAREERRDGGRGHQVVRAARSRRHPEHLPEWDLQPRRQPPLARQHGDGQERQHRPRLQHHGRLLTPVGLLHGATRSSPPRTRRISPPRWRASRAAVSRG